MRVKLQSKFDSPLQGGRGGRGGKYERVLKLVNIWRELKECPEVVERVHNQRAARMAPDMIHFREYVEVMERVENAALEAVENANQKFLSFKVEPLTAEDLARQWKSEGSHVLSADEYPCCPHPDCAHIYIDGPPANLEADRINQENVRDYVSKSQAFERWKKKQGPQPIDDSTGELMSKPPKPPTTLSKYLHCHCHQVRTCLYFIK